jgi:Fe-S cluster assembly scaffold protein SufB
MFYLQTRGINKNDAKKLLTKGFINEMILDYPLELKSKVSQQLEFLI